MRFVVELFPKHLTLFLLDLFNCLMIQLFQSMNTHQEEIVVGSKVYDSEHGRGVVVKVSKAHYTIQFGFMTMVREKKQVRLQR